MDCAGAADVGAVAASAPAMNAPSSQARMAEIVLIAVPPREVEVDVATRIETAAGGRLTE
jgi:hypothetical protein